MGRGTTGGESRKRYCGLTKSLAIRAIRSLMILSLRSAAIVSVKCIRHTSIGQLYPNARDRLSQKVEGDLEGDWL
jgi:hypothetical protein